MGARSGSGVTFILTGYGLNVLRTEATLSFVALVLVVAGLLLGFEGGLPDSITDALVGTGAVLLGFALVLTSWTLAQAGRAQRINPQDGG